MCGVRQGSQEVLSRGQLILGKFLKNMFFLLARAVSESNLESWTKENFNGQFSLTNQWGSVYSLLPGR